MNEVIKLRVEIPYSKTNIEKAFPGEEITEDFIMKMAEESFGELNENPLFRLLIDGEVKYEIVK